MSQQKSYNIQALQGHEYSDRELQTDMAQIGITIPDSALFKPEINEYVARAIYESNKDDFLNTDNPITGKKYSAEEAETESRKLYTDTMNRVDRLLKVKQ